MYKIVDILQTYKNNIYSIVLKYDNRAFLRRSIDNRFLYISNIPIFIQKNNSKCVAEYLLDKLIEDLKHCNLNICLKEELLFINPDVSHIYNIAIKETGTYNLLTKITFCNCYELLNIYQLWRIISKHTANKDLNKIDEASFNRIASKLNYIDINILKAIEQGFAETNRVAGILMHHVSNILKCDEKFHIETEFILRCYLYEFIKEQKI